MKRYKQATVALVLTMVATLLGIGIASAVTSSDLTTTDCPGAIFDDGATYTVTATCQFPKPPAETVTATATATATVTATETATATATVTATETATVTASPTEPTETPTETPTEPPGACAVSTPYVPDGPDNAGGCFPGPSNTGPDAPKSSMATYTGSCTISAANVVIDSKVVNCDIRLTSGAGGFVLSNSYLNGSVSQATGTPSFTVKDALVDGAIDYPACSDGSCPAGKYACADCGVGGSNFTILRTEIINTNRASWCENTCTIQDSYFHGTNLWPSPSNHQHASAMRMDRNGVIRHNSLHCSYVGPFFNDDPGCSADLSGYPDFAPVKNNTIDGNLFVASQYSGFCAYGGATGGKPYSGDATNATNIKFTNNVFQRSSVNDHGQPDCGSFGPITDFAPNRTGNVWSGNVWDTGGTVPDGT